MTGCLPKSPISSLATPPTYPTFIPLLPLELSQCLWCQRTVFFSSFFFSRLLQIWTSMPPPWGSSPRLHLGEVCHLTYAPSIDFWAPLRVWNHLVEQHWDDSSQDTDSVYSVHCVESWGRGRILLNWGKTRITHSPQVTVKKVGFVAL